MIRFMPSLFRDVATGLTFIRRRGAGLATDGWHWRQVVPLRLGFYRVKGDWFADHSINFEPI